MQYMMEKANNIDSDQTAIALFRSSLILVHIVCLFFLVGSLISCLDGAINAFGSHSDLQF